MVIRRAREGNKDRRFARSCDFRNRASPRSTDQEAGFSEGGRHVVNKAMSLRSTAQGRIGRVDLSKIFFPSLMNYAQLRIARQEFARALHHDHVNRMRSLAAAEHQQSGCLRVASLDEELLAHRHARNLTTLEIAPSFFEMNCGCRHERRDHTIRKARHKVWFENERRYATDNRS